MAKSIKATAKSLAETDRAHVWHPFTQMSEWVASEPLIIEKGSGNYLVDINGKRYLDGVSSLWVNVHGHRKKEIDFAIAKQLKRIAHSTQLGLASVPAIELAEKLVGIAPKGLTKVFYSDNGSTAVEIALKMAFQYWQQTRGGKGRKKFVAFTGAYHGDTFGSMSVGEIDTFVGIYKPLLFNTLRAPYPYCYRCPMDRERPSCKTYCLTELERMLKEHDGEIAACIIEPMIQGAAGMITSPAGFLRGVRRLTKKYNVLLIVDEVATGFGRTGAMFASDIEGVRPDIMCMAKGLTGGYLPLAATMTTKKIFNAFLGRPEEYRAFYHGHTYTGNQLGAAAAIANIEIFNKERVIERMGAKIEFFKNRLEGFYNLARVGDVRSIGLMAGIELVKERATKETYASSERMGRRVSELARERGVIIRPLGDVIVIMPPLSITTAELKKIMDVVYNAIDEVTG